MHYFYLTLKELLTKSLDSRTCLKSISPEVESSIIRSPVDLQEVETGIDVTIDY